LASRLFLGLLFLYNPFFLTSSGLSPTIERHISYRSTVASSELGCSTLQHSKLHISLIELLVGTEKLALQPKETTHQQDFHPVEPTEPIMPAPDATPLILEALQQRPEVNALQLQVESAPKNSTAEHDLWRPTITALGVVGITALRDPNISGWYGAAGVNVNSPLFNGFLYRARAKTADLQTEVARQKLTNLRNNIARDVRTSWQQTTQAYERLSVTQS
jgi:outer membrane protein TolC